MSQEREGDQLQQRRDNLSELRALGVEPYPRSFALTDTVSVLVETHVGTDGDALDADHVHTAVAGRIVAIRSFGKASFLVLSDGRSRIQVYVRQDSVSERDFAIYGLLDFGDIVGVSGRLFPDPDTGAHRVGRRHRVSVQVPGPTPREVARSDRC